MHISLRAAGRSDGVGPQLRRLLHAKRGSLTLVRSEVPGYTWLTWTYPPNAETIAHVCGCECNNIWPFSGSINLTVRPKVPTQRGHTADDAGEYSSREIVYSTPPQDSCTSSLRRFACSLIFNRGIRIKYGAPGTWNQATYELGWPLLLGPEYPLSKHIPPCVGGFKILRIGGRSDGVQSTSFDVCSVEKVNRDIANRSYVLIDQRYHRRTIEGSMILVRPDDVLS